ncbi:diguanylate cyclase [Paraburkholderia sp. OAS925]|uniref:diguanylate cyclase domain-containing protein n=1 Tax=Paraburkholderia sp. OAS925 TaxID=2663827 RepID=UPI0036707892
MSSCCSQPIAATTPNCGNSPSALSQVCEQSATKSTVAVLRFGVSIGIATFPDRVQSIAGLLDVADAAMYAAKRSGRSTYSFGNSPAAGLSNVIKLTR